jgi:hypothetical protein
LEEVESLDTRVSKLEEHNPKVIKPDRRSCLRMDIIEANECLRAWYGKPRKGTFDDKAVGVEEGEQRDKSDKGGDEESSEDTSPASTIDKEVDEDVASHISVE